MCCALYKHEQTITTVAFSSDGKNLVSGSQDGKFIMWDMAKEDAVKVLDTRSSVVCSAFCPGKKLAAMAGDSLIFWDIHVKARIRFRS